MKLGRRLVAVAATVVLGTPFGAIHAAAAPAGYPISGIDVSAFQDTIDWAGVAAGGAKFAYIRASEQQGIADATFAANYQGAKANGLYAGAYHRARPDVSGGKAQADYLVDHSGYVEDGRTFPPMLDIEWPRSNWPGLDACYNMTPAQLTAWIRDFVTEVTARTGVLAMIYTNPNWWNPCTANDTTFGAYPLFNSGYLPSPPPPPAGWATWTLWQYSNSGTLPGDQDVFNGDYLALARLAGGTPFGLRAHANGKYVTADNGGSSPLMAQATVIAAWEKFTVVVNPDASVSLRSFANGKYVTAENGGTSALIANRTAIGGWEQFDEVLPAALVSLKAKANGLFVTADDGGSSPLIANRTAVSTWELFDQVDAGNGYLGLKARANGRYVTAENAGAAALIANRTAVSTWESFRAVVNLDASVSLLALADGRYVTAASGTPLIASSPTAGTSQQFRDTVR